MKIILRIALPLLLSWNATADSYHRLTVDEYRSRMTAGWIGQMAGVGWGAPTEFRFNGRIVPVEEMPSWKPEMINQFWQDDIYVEMTFIKSLEDYGWDVSYKQAGLDFAASKYPLWHANNKGRENLCNGIAPPDSGHPQFNDHADDIDYQIESDFAGLIAPGNPNLIIELGEKFGRIMNYGDGVYGGQFVGGMYAAAFFESDMDKIVEAGLKCIPKESQYAECIRDVVRWWKENPNDWVAAWNLIEAKYNENPEYRRFSCGEKKKDFNIDAKINGAYIVMGLLYGEGDPDKTIEISTRCGQDSDCNPSSAAGILFASLGLERIPDKFTSALNHEGVFTHTAYSFDKLIAVSEKLAREAIVRGGGKIESDKDGKEVFLIKRQKAKPSPLEQCWAPGPIANSRYTAEDNVVCSRPRRMPDGSLDISTLVEEFAPGWKIAQCGTEMDPDIRPEFRGRQGVLATHPLDPENPCILWREFAVAPNTKLRLKVSHHDGGDWQLVVKIDGNEALSQVVSKDTVAPDGWLDAEVDLAPYAGKTVKLEVLNQATEWFYEAAYWGVVKVE